MSDPTTRLARKATRYSPLLRQLHREVYWVPLVATWIDTNDVCDNPRCEDTVDMRHSFVVQGDILTIKVCFDCGLKIAIDSGMVRDASEFAVAALKCPSE